MKTSLDGIEVEARHPWRAAVLAVGIGLLLLATVLYLVLQARPPDPPSMPDLLGHDQRSLLFEHSRARHLAAVASDEQDGRLTLTPFLDAVDTGRPWHDRSSSERKTALDAIQAQLGRLKWSAGYDFLPGLPLPELRDRITQLVEELSASDRARLQAATQDYTITRIAEGRLTGRVGEVTLPPSSSSPWSGWLLWTGRGASGLLLLVGGLLLVVGARLGPRTVRVTPAGLHLGERFVPAGDIVEVQWWPRPQVHRIDGETLHLRGRQLPPDTIDALDDAVQELLRAAPAEGTSTVDAELQALRGRVRSG